MESLIIRVQCTNESEENFRAMRVCYDAFVSYLRRKKIVFIADFNSDKQSCAEIEAEGVPQEVCDILNKYNGVMRIIDRADNGNRCHMFVCVAIGDSALGGILPEVCTVGFAQPGSGGEPYSKNRHNDKFFPVETFTSGDFDTFWAE